MTVIISWFIVCRPGPHLAVEVALLSSPARGTGTASVQSVAGASVPTLAGEVAADAPGATGTTDGTVHSVPTWVEEG